MILTIILLNKKLAAKRNKFEFLTCGQCGLKDEELLLSNNDSLDDIFKSDQWENFFQTLLNDPENASYMCKKKCGVDVDMDKLKQEERKEVTEQANGADY